jgi:transposase
MPAQYVKPYVKRSKNDANDAEAICEAVTRPSMRFVPIKTRKAQALAMLHRARQLLISQRTAMMNSLRSGLAEFGIVAPQGMGGATLLRTAAASCKGLPKSVREAYAMLAETIRTLEEQEALIDRRIAEALKRDKTCARLETIPGVGPVISSTIVAFAGELSRFPSARHFAAWLGLTPRQYSSGGKVRMGGITKAGDKTLRTLLVLGSFSVIRRARTDPAKASPWLLALLARRPALVAAVALANKTARVIWALVMRGGTYRGVQVA